MWRRLLMGWMDMGDCFLFPFEKLITGPKWKQEYEHYIQNHVLKVLNYNFKEEIIYEKLNELMTSEYQELYN